MRIVAGALKGLQLVSDVSPSTRPTSDATRESIFNILESRINIEGSVADLYAGTGALGIEAFSRGAIRVVFVETDKKACNIISRNIELVKQREHEGQLEVQRTPVLTFVQQSENESAFSLVLADPPYEDDIESEVIAVVSSGGYLVYEMTAEKLDRCRDEFLKHPRTEEVVLTRKMGNTGVVIVRAI